MPPMPPQPQSRLPPHHASLREFALHHRRKRSHSHRTLATPCGRNASGPTGCLPERPASISVITIRRQAAVKGVPQAVRVRIHFASAFLDTALFRMLDGRLATTGPQA